MKVPVSAMGHLPDESDRATELEMAMTASAIAQARARVKRQQEPNAKGVYAVTECEECGNEIGEGRLKVAAMNLWCVFCASLKEKQR